MICFVLIFFFELSKNDGLCHWIVIRKRAYFSKNDQLFIEKN
jgi:hypothetical protein